MPIVVYPIRLVLKRFCTALGAKSDEYTHRPITEVTACQN